jgi:hypothetical protein
MTTTQLTVWFGTLLAVFFMAGCTIGYSFHRAKAQKVSHARKSPRR